MITALRAQIARLEARREGNLPPPQPVRLGASPREGELPAVAAAGGAQGAPQGG
jgi:hypothetical protein